MLPLFMLVPFLCSLFMLPLFTSIQKLEENYDHEVFDTQMDDLKDFLNKQGVRVD